MKCIKCRNEETRVVNSRIPNSKDWITRRRECMRCKHRFTTYETVDSNTNRDTTNAHIVTGIRKILRHYTMHRVNE